MLPVALPAAPPLAVAPPDDWDAPPDGSDELLDGEDDPLLPEEPDGLLGLLGGDDCGWVGVLALGQPVSSRQRRPTPAMPDSGRHAALLNIECFDNVLCLYGLSRLEPRPESGSAQLPH